VRPDIQGLRAVAVLLVVANHLWDYPRGGFVGVDVFFVLSGFLITGLLLKEQQGKGRISYLDFYRRRIRRIIPAATLVIVVTVAATYLLYSRGRGEGVASDGLWAFLFASNWHFAAVGTDYFQSNGSISPLQHYWSLAVEEQFYIVWPTLLAVLLALRGDPAKGRRLLLPVAAAATALLFVYSLGHTSSNPVHAYFSTLDRAWELGVGATLAIAAPVIGRLPRLLRPVLGWLGLAGIAASVLLISPDVAFPAPWAALPVLSTALVVAAGTGHQQRYLFPIVNPVATYVGDISYSLYLWHFPVIVLLLAVFPDGGALYQGVALVGLGLLSVLSFHMVEDPIRQSDWLEPRHRRHPGRSGFDRTRLANQWIVVSLLVVLPFTALQLRGQETPQTGSLLTAKPARGGGAETAAAYLTERIEQSLSLKDFPRLEPGIDSLGNENWFEQLTEDGCANVVPDDADECRFGKPDAAKLAVVYGDSYAMAWMPAVRAALEPRGYRVQQLTLQECPVWDAPTLTFDGRPYPQCGEYRRWATARIHDLEPDLLVLASSDKVVGLLASGAGPEDAADEVRSAWDRELTALHGAAGHTVTLAPPPGTRNLQDCMTRLSEPDDCALDIKSYWHAVTDLEREAAAEHGVDYLDTHTWFCAAEHCPAFVGATPVFADGSHLTQAYARQLGPVLEEALFGPATKARKHHTAAKASAAQLPGEQLPLSPQQGIPVTTGDVAGVEPGEVCDEGVERQLPADGVRRGVGQPRVPHLQPGATAGCRPQREVDRARGLAGSGVPAHGQPVPGVVVPDVDPGPAHPGSGPGDDPVGIGQRGPDLG